MKKLFIPVLLVAFLFLLVGCNPFLNKGYVIKKQYYPAHWVTHFNTVCTAKGVCTTSPVTTYYPELWEVSINECPEGTVPQKNESCDENSFSISHEQYERVLIGSWYDFGKEH